jgi:predicted metal-dependent peptidase
MAAPFGKETLYVKRLKTAVTMRSAFYASLMLNLDFVPDPTVKTAEVDGIQCRYNPTYVEGELTFEQAQGLFAHESHHCGANHHTRQGDRELELYKYAADYATNPEVLEAGFELPPGAVYDERFRQRILYCH